MSHWRGVIVLHIIPCKVEPKTQLPNCRTRNGPLIHPPRYAQKTLSSKSVTGSEHHSGSDIHAGQFHRICLSIPFLWQQAEALNMTD